MNEEEDTKILSEGDYQKRIARIKADFLRKRARNRRRYALVVVLKILILCIVIAMSLWSGG